MPTLAVKVNKPVCPRPCALPKSTSLSVPKQSTRPLEKLGAPRTKHVFHTEITHFKHKGAISTGWDFCCAKETHPCFLFFFYFDRLFRSAESRAPAALMLRPGMHTDCMRTQRTRVSLVTALVTSPRGITDEERRRRRGGGAPLTQGSIDQ